MELIHISITAVSLYSHHTDIEAHELKLGKNNAEARAVITNLEKLKSDPLNAYWELPLVATFIHTHKR